MHWLNNGLVILAAGKKLYRKVNLERYLDGLEYDQSFWKWFAEKHASHPHLPKRIKNIQYFSKVGLG